MKLHIASWLIATIVKKGKGLCRTIAAFFVALVSINPISKSEELPTMNCYACLVETGDITQAACAVCKECGAGICHTHTVDVTHTTPAGSISMVATPRSRLLCQRCYRALFPASSSPRAKGYVKGYDLLEKSLLGRLWHRLWQRQPAAASITLPTPEQAVNAVEDFLKQQVTPKKHRDIEWPD